MGGKILQRRLYPSLHLRTSGKRWLSQKLKPRKREQFCGTTRIPPYIPLENRNSRFSRLVLRENLTLRIASAILRISSFVNWLPSCKKAPCHSYFFAAGEKCACRRKFPILSDQMCFSCKLCRFSQEKSGHCYARTLPLLIAALPRTLVL